MPFSPTALPWWGWLTCALVLLVLSRLAWESSDPDEAMGCGWSVLAVALLLLALLTGGVGLVQFVKWAWSG